MLPKARGSEAIGGGKVRCWGGGSSRLMGGLDDEAVCGPEEEDCSGASKVEMSKFSRGPVAVETMTDGGGADMGGGSVGGTIDVAIGGGADMEDAEGGGGATPGAGVGYSHLTRSVILGG